MLKPILRGLSFIENRKWLKTTCDTCWHCALLSGRYIDNGIKYPKKGPEDGCLGKLDCLLDGSGANKFEFDHMHC